MSAGVFGRSSVFTSCLVVTHCVVDFLGSRNVSCVGVFCGTRGSVFCGTRGSGVCAVVGALGSGSVFCGTRGSVFCADVGVIFTCHNRAPDVSRSPCRILVPFLSCTSSIRLSRYAVQSSSQSLPRLRRLLVKPGMMWPVRALSDCMVGMASTAAPVDVLVSPVAVQIVVLGALTLMLIMGAVVVK